MTKKLLLIVTLFSLIFFVPNVKAENVTTGSAQATTPTLRPGQQIQQLQEQRKVTVTQIRDEAKTLIQTKRAEFNARVATIKDQNKKSLVERIDARISEVNANQTTKFIETLNRLQAFIDRSKSATGTATVTDIANAQTAVDTAKAAVTAQASKTYILTIADDSTLRITVGATVSQFRQDLSAVYKLVVNAKVAVQKLYVNKETIRREATNSAR